MRRLSVIVLAVLSLLLPDTVSAGVPESAPTRVAARAAARRRRARSRRARGRRVCRGRGRRRRCRSVTRAVAVAPASASRVTVASPAVAADLLARANTERAARGLPALAWDEGLGAAAGGWAANMAANGFRHQDMNALIGALGGRFSAVAENIVMLGSGMSSAGQAHLAWMRSDSHRAALLAPGLDRVGIGVVCAADGSLWAVQDFGGPGPVPGATGTPPPGPVAAPDPGGPACA